MNRAFGHAGHMLAKSITHTDEPIQINTRVVAKLRRNILVLNFTRNPLKSFCSWLHYWLHEVICYMLHRPGVILEVNKEAIGKDVVEELSSRLGSYFGGIHISEKSGSLLQYITKIKLRGINHLVIILGDRFRWNGSSMFSNANYDSHYHAEILLESCKERLMRDRINSFMPNFK